MRISFAKVLGGGGGSTNYNDLSNKPKINDTTLSGNKTAADLGLLSNPTGGTAGQVLTKTEDGEEWADSQGGGGDTSEIEEAAAAALNELWWKTLSPARKTVLREDIIDDFKHPYSSHPISARIAKVLDEHLKEIELIAASALVNLNEMKAFMGAIAPEWDGQHAYSVGDLRTHGGKLWKCDTAYDEPEDTFDAAKWHTTTIVEEFITAE